MCIWLSPDSQNKMYSLLCKNIDEVFFSPVTSNLTLTLVIFAYGGHWTDN